MSHRHMKLGAFLYATGHHVAGWRSPQAQADAGFNIRHYIDVARRCEAALFDLLFLEDGVAVREPDLDVASHTARGAHFEPLTLLSAIAVNTSSIGLVGTVSTSYQEPYHVARTIASIDHLSGGRAGWNLVTSQSDLEARNFGLDLQRLHSKRYERAEEFVDVVVRLWDSYDDGAVIADKQSGTYYDEALLRRLEHKGEHFAVRGPLNIIRTPQGRPVVVQAGASDAGIALAARTAEIVFTAAQTLAEGQAYYAALKQKAVSFGRAPESILVMPGVFPVVGRSRDEAAEKFEELQSLILPEVGLALLAQHLGTPSVKQLDPDAPFPDDLMETNGNKSRQKLLMELARREKLTVRELYERIAGARGHWQIVGTAEDVVDQMEERFNNNAADGFNIMPSTIPGGLTDFMDLILPELRRRGLARTRYDGTTLRENLALARPARTN